MASGQRRIDVMYCTRETARDRVRHIVSEIERAAEVARQEVSMAISHRLEALQQRQKELISAIDRVAKQKGQALQKQIRAIEAGTCPPAPPEEDDEDPEPNPDLFILCADSVIKFKIGEEDFLEKIAKFGQVTEASTYASRSYARGPALSAMKVGKPTYCWIYTCDRDGQRRTEGGDVIGAAVSNWEDFEKVEVEDTKDGKYKVTFLPWREGPCTINLAVAGELVRGAPFTVQIRPPTAYEVIGMDPNAPCIGSACDFVSTGKPGLLGSMGHPSGVDFDHTGKFVFVADQANHRVQVFDVASGNAPVTAFGRKGFGPTDFDSPCDLVVDNENRVIVSDLLNHRLQVLEFVPRTRELRHVLTVSNDFQFPKGLGVTEQGHLLACDSGNHRVQVFDMLDGFKFLREFGTLGTGEGQFTTPLDVAVNRAGEILVSDASNRISIFDGQGQFLRQFGGKGRREGLFNYPYSIAVNDENVLFVCDQGNHRVQVLDASDGSFLHKWGGSKRKKAENNGDDPDAADGGEGDGKPLPDWQGMQKPSGIAVNAEGLVIVADYLLNVLWTYGGAAAWNPA